MDAPLINEAVYLVGVQDECDDELGFKLISVLRIVFVINIFLVSGKP